MGGGIAAVLCVLLFALPLGLLIGAAILRGGVHFANKCIPREVDRDYDDDWDDDYDDRPKRRRRRGSSAAIPEPALGKAMGIVFVNAIIGFIISIPISLVMGGGMNMKGGQQDPAMALIATLIQLPLGFLVAAGVRTAMLPTTFPRACLVVVFEYLIVLAICVIIGVPLVMLAFLAR